MFIIHSTFDVILGTWINVDGTAYEGPFADGRPNDLGNEDCMNLWDINGTLAPNDEECDKLGAGVVCAKPQRGHPKCFDGWYLYGGKCFTRVLGNFNYSQAVDSCNSFGRNAIISAPEHYGELVGGLWFDKPSFYVRFTLGFLFQALKMFCIVPKTEKSENVAEITV